MKKLWFIPILLIGRLGYAQSETEPYTELFCPIDTAWQGDTLVVPQGPLRYDILLQEGDIVYNIEKGTNAPLKGGFGGVFYDRNEREDINIAATNFSKNTEGRLYLSLQDNKISPVGDGGGYVTMQVKQNDAGGWSVVPQTEGGTTFDYRFRDLDGLGGTFKNNGIHLGYSSLSAVVESPTKGNIFMYDAWAASNDAISTGFTSTGNFTLPEDSPDPGLSIPRYKNMGWVIEINKQTGMPVKKVYFAGRADIGGLSVSSQKSTDLPAEALYDKRIIFTTQTQPAVIIRYERSDNVLYAYKQDAGGYEGAWVMLNEMDVDGSLFPFSFEELSDIRKIALQKGATMFNNLGGLVKERNGSYYIAETGGEAPAGTFSDPGLIFSGSPAHHLSDKIAADGSTDDHYGRLLKMYTNDEGSKVIVEPYLEGGTTADTRYTFSNPKNIWYYNFDYTPDAGTLSSAQYLIISEQVTDAGFRRNPSGITDASELMNEVYFINADITHPDLSDLRPFAIGPKGAELQAAFPVEGPGPMFLSIRYPNTGNTAPYNKSLLVAVNNFEAYFADPEACGWVQPPPGTDTTTAITEPGKMQGDGLTIWPNPASRTLYFGKLQNEVMVYDVNGRMIKRAVKIKELDIFDLVPGFYIIRNDKRQARKIIIR